MGDKSDIADRKVLLLALNSKKNLRVAIESSNAMNWNINQIAAAIDDIGKNPKHRGVVASCQDVMPRVCERLVTFLKKLIKLPAGEAPNTWTLKENGHEDFINLDLPIPLDTAQPTANKSNLGSSDSAPELNLGALKSKQSALETKKTVPTVRFFRAGVFDVLGWILSSFGPVTTPNRGQGFADERAILVARDTFLGPLLALYGIWCYTLGSCGGTFKEERYKKYPSVVELAVRLVSPTQMYFALGASVAGMSFQDKADTGEERRRMMEKHNLLKLHTTDTISRHTEKPIREDVLKWSPNQLISLLRGDPTVKGLPVWDPEKTFLENDKNQVTSLVRPNESHVFKGWRDIYEFADFLLNPEVLSNLQLAPDSGTKFGNCAETYPLLILGDKNYEEITRIKSPTKLDPFGGLALAIQPPRDANILGTIVEAGGITLTELSPCLNCRRVLKAIGASDKSLLVNDRKPVVVTWECLKKKALKKESGSTGSPLKTQARTLKL